MAYEYDDVTRPDILRMVPQDGRVIGSIGCGTGANELPLVQQGREVHGVDISDEAIAIAKQRLTSARVIEPGNISPFPEESLDGLLLADVIEHIPRAWEVLPHYVRAVRPGGWVVVSVPNMRNIDVLKQFIFIGDWPEHGTGIFDATHLQVMSKRRLQRWCEAAGLEIERWFDQYDPRGPRRYRFFRALDLLSLKLFHSWFMYQLQIRCRRVKTTEAR